jgi:hypothetical protein
MTGMKRYVTWGGAVVTLVIIFGTLFGVVQQAQRMDANMPQIQLAEDTATSLNNGIDPNSLAQGTVDINKSLAPFIVIYDKKGAVVATSGFLNHGLPHAPLGILQASNGTDYHAITWQPQADIRIAAVTVSANKYYVLSGRSLKEVEKNETKSLALACAGGIATLFVLAGVYLVRRYL